MTIKEETGGINRKIFEKHFGYKMLTAMLRDLLYSDKEENNILVPLIRDGLRNLINEILAISEDEVRNKNLDKTVDIVEKILDLMKDKDIKY